MEDKKPILERADHGFLKEVYLSLKTLMASFHHYHSALIEQAFG